MNNEDSRIRRLREYVNLYLRRYGKVDKNEKYGIFFLFEKSIIKSRESEISRVSKRHESRNSQNQSNNVRNKERVKKIKEEVGRNYHTINNEPITYDTIHDDVRVEIFPTHTGSKYRAIVAKGKRKFQKDFPTEEEAKLWSRNTTARLSDKITQ